MSVHAALLARSCMRNCSSSRVATAIEAVESTPDINRADILVACAKLIAQEITSADRAARYVAEAVQILTDNLAAQAVEQHEEECNCHGEA